MRVSRASKRGNVYFLVSMRPESFAFRLYSLILSILVANLLWLKVCYLCSTMDVQDMDYLVNRLIYIHMVFAIATTYVWWLLNQDHGKSVLTHVIFFVWQGSKLMVASLEICSLPRFYNKLVNTYPKEDISDLTYKISLASFLVLIVECLGLVLASKYLRGKTPKSTLTKALPAPSMAV